jgi:drug/metabolite transporter (DMT)-like permease
MASVLALIAAFLFAVAATFQQKGALNEGEVSLGQPATLVRLLRQRWWLLGTAALVLGWGFQAAALDRGRVAIIQPLLVTTVVFALPLGYYLTGQQVGRREVLGAAVIVIGLGLFAVFGDPAGGRNNAPTNEWVIAIAVVSVASAAGLYFGSHGGLSMKAAVYGAVAGAMYGLAAVLTKPVLTAWHESLHTVITDWQLYALAVAGGLGFVLQQVSLGTGRLAPSVATVSVANPIVSVLLAVILLQERLSRPAWHVVLALVGLGLALAGAAVISLAREAAKKPEPVPSTS